MGKRVRASPFARLAPASVELFPLPDPLGRESVRIDLAYPPSSPGATASETPAPATGWRSTGATPAGAQPLHAGAPPPQRPPTPNRSRRRPRRRRRFVSGAARYLINAANCCRRGAARPHKHGPHAYVVDRPVGRTVCCVIQGLVAPTAVHNSPNRIPPPRPWLDKRPGGAYVAGAGDQGGALPRFAPSRPGAVAARAESAPERTPSRVSRRHVPSQRRNARRAGSAGGACRVSAGTHAEPASAAGGRVSAGTRAEPGQPAARAESAPSVPRRHPRDWPPRRRPPRDGDPVRAIPRGHPATATPAAPSPPPRHPAPTSPPPATPPPKFRQPVTARR